MARINTYANDTNITSSDKLLGSNYQGLDNQGRPIFTTVNFKVEDLLTYFQDNISIGGNSLSLLSGDLNKIKSNYTYDENGNITGLSTAGVNLIANSEVGDLYASASFEAAVNASVITFNPDGTINTLSEAFANLVLQTETTTDYASASILNNVIASIGTDDGNGNITVSEAFANTILNAETTTDYATASFVTNLGSSIGTVDADGNLTVSEAFANQVLQTETTTDYAEASFVTNLATSIGTVDANGNVTVSESFANSVMNTENTTDYASAQSVTNLSSTVSTKPDIFRQDDAPAITEAVGSLWYDTNDNNKLYILVAGDPDNVWTETTDGQIGILTTSLATATSNISTNATNIGNNATFATNLAGSFGTYDSDGNITALSTAFANSVMNTETATNYADANDLTTLESTVAIKPNVYRQDDAPSIYTGDPAEQVIPDASIWYDTNNDNKVYIVAEDPENAGTRIWTLTDDSRIGATASKVTSMAAKFGTFDVNNDFTISGSSDYLDAVVTKVDADSATATKIENLSAELGTFDANNNFSTSLSANFKTAVNNEVDANSATAGYINNLSAAVGIDKLDGTPQSQATALVNGATNTTTTSTLDGAVSQSKQLVLTAANTNIEVGQYVTYSSQTSTINRDLVWRVEAIDGINIYLDNEISLEDATTVTFTGTTSLVVDNVSGTIREGFQIKGTGVSTGTFVSAVSGNNITLSIAENLADDTSLEFLGIYAAVNQTANVVAKVDGSLESTYGLQVDANGNVAGMKLLANNEGSEISFLADSFKVYNGSTATAPFEVVNGIVKIKSANIGTVNFGDLNGIPDYFVVTVVYADDASGTNASTTKGANQNFYGIHQGQEAWQDGDSVSGITFIQITGDTGPTGENGLRTVTGVLFWSVGSATAPTKPTYDSNDVNSEVTYTYSTGAFSGNGLDTNGANAGTWQKEAPEMAAGTASNKYWTVDYTILQGQDTDTTASLSDGEIIFGTPVQAFAFNQVVTFSSLSTSGSTTINGDNITTGVIKDNNYAYVSGNYSSQGTEIDLSDGSITSENFYINGTTGAAGFKGNLEAAGGTFRGAVDILDADDDTVVKVHNGTFSAADNTGTSTTFPNISNHEITTWSNNAADITYVEQIVGTGATISSLFDDDDDYLYSTASSVTFDAGSHQHTITTAAINNTIVELNSTWNGFMTVALGVEFGNSDFSTVYLHKEIHREQILASGSMTFPTTSTSVSLGFATQTTVYVRFYWRRIWKTNNGTSTFYPRTLDITSNLSFAGKKGRAELSPNGIQVLNTDDIYFKIDRTSFTSGNPYVDIGGDVKVDGNFTVTGNINLEGDVENSDVTVNNLLERLEQINTSFTIGNSTSADATFAGDVQVDGVLKGPATFTIDPAAHGDDTGTLVIAGNLQVDGTTTTINSTTLTVDDKNIVLANGAANAAAANGAGITIDGANATMLYESASDRLVFNKDLEVTSGQIRVENDSTDVAKIVFSENTNEDVVVLEYNGVGTGGTNYFQIYSNVTGWAGKGDSLNIQPSTGRVAIGNTSFDEVLHVTGNVKATTFIGNLNGSADQVDGLDATDFTLDYVTDNGASTTNNITVGNVTANNVSATEGNFEDLFLTNASGASLSFRNSQGNTVDTDNLATVSFQGYYDSAFVGASRIQVKANENFSSTARGTVINFDFWDTGSVYDTVASIDADGFYIGTTNVYDNLPDGITYSTTDNKLKIGVSKNVGGTVETNIQPILLADVLNEGYIPYVATGDGGSVSGGVNSKVSDSWLKVTSDTLELGDSDPVSHEIRYARFLWQSGSNDKISTVYGARDITASVQYLGGSATAKIAFTTGTNAGRIRFNDAFSFPASDGTSGQVLTTNGSGSLSWGDASATVDLQDVTGNGATTTNTINAEGGIIAGTGGASDWGDLIIDTSLDAGWGTTNKYPYIGSTGGSIGSIIMLHNPHVPFRTENAITGYDGRAGLRMARNTTGDYWDMGLAGDFFHIYRNGTGEFLRIDNSGNVGIGTDSPDTIINAAAADNTILRLESTDTTPSADQKLGGVEFYGNGSTLGAGVYGSLNGFYEDTAGRSYLTLSTRTSTGLFERMRIDSSGNVGIGTSSPLGTTHIKSGVSGFTGTLNANYDDLAIEGSGNSGITILTPNNNNAGIAFSDEDAEVQGLILYGHSDNFMAFRTAGTERMRIDSSGNITQTASDASLSVNASNAGGTASISINGLGSNGTSTAGTRIDGIPEGSGSAASMAFVTRDSSGTREERMRINSSGFVGINESIPLVPLHISKDTASGENIALILDNNDSTANSEIGLLFRSYVGSTNTDFQIATINKSANNADLVFRSDGATERMRIESSGNVGINESNAESLLHLKGLTNQVGITLENPQARKYQLFSNGTTAATGSFAIYDATAASDVFTIDSSGRVSINDTISGSVATNYNPELLVGGNIVARSLTANEALIEIGGDATSAFITAGKQDGSQTARALRFEVGTTEAIHIDSSGDVGIGTDSPQTKLHLTGAITISDVGANDNTTLIQFGESTNYDQFAIKGDFAGVIGENKLKFTTDLGGGDILTLKGDGNVGINTNSPSYKLDVNSGSGSTISRFYNSATSAIVNIGSSANTSFADLYLETSTGNSQVFRNAGSTGWGGTNSLNIYNNNGAIAFHPNNTANALFIDTNSNVGIGTTSLTEKLTVAGDAYITGGTDYTLKLGRTSGKPSIKAETDDGGYLLMDSNGGMAGLNWYSSNNVILALGGGNVGIGTSSASEKLSVNGNIFLSGDDDYIAFNTSGSSGNPKIKMNSDADFSFLNTVGTNTFHIENGGNVGIGTTTPAQKLHVNGIIRADSAIRIEGSPGDTISSGPNIFFVGGTGSSYSQIQQGTNKLDFWGFNGSAWGINMSIDNTNRRVGIGTTSPSAKLQVADGDISITGGANNRSIYIDGSNFNFRATTTSGWAFALRSTTNDGGTIMSTVAGAYGNGPLNSDFQYNYYGGTAYNDAAMYIPASKNVGIGITSPSYKLHVNASSIQPTADLLMGEVAYSTSSSHIGLKTTFQSGANDYMIISGKTDGNTYVSAKDGGSVYLRGGGNWSANQIAVHDNNYVTTDGGHRFGTGGTSSWGNAIVHTGSGAGWGSGSYPYIGSVNGSTGSLIMLHNMHVPFRTDNAASSSHTGRAGIRCAIDTSASNWWDIGLAGDFFHLYKNGTGELFRVTNNGAVHADNDIVAFSTTTSDARLKDDVKTIDNALDKVLSMRGVEYVWNNGSRKGQKDLGVIAQEMEQVIPEIVREHEMPLMDNSGEKYKTVDYEKLTSVLIEAIKEQQKQIDELKARLDGSTK